MAIGVGFSNYTKFYSVPPAVKRFVLGVVSFYRLCFPNSL